MVIYKEVRLNPVIIKNLKEYDVLEWCDLSQAEENTKVLSHLKNIVLKNCYIKNAVFPETFAILNCYTNLAGLKKFYKDPDSLPAVTEGSIFWECNFSFKTIASIFPNVNNIGFFKCTLRNVNTKQTYLLHKCNVYKADLCANLHPNLDLPSEPENCPHVKHTLQISIDGVLKQTFYQYEDGVL